MLSPIVPLNRNASCGTMPICERSERARDVAQVVAVDEHAAVGRVVEARDELGERRLARAGRADEGDGLAGRHDQRRRRRARASARPRCGSGTRRPRSAISPRMRGEVARVGRVDELGLLVEQLEDLVERRHAGLVGRVDLRELADRVEEAVERGDEADEHADLDVAVDRPGRRRRAGSPTVATAATNSTAGKYAALRLTVTMLASRLISLSSAKRARWRGSWAKARTTRMPDSVSCR